MFDQLAESGAIMPQERAQRRGEILRGVQFTRRRPTICRCHDGSRSLPSHCLQDGIYLRLTESRQSGNHPLATVSPMATTSLHRHQGLSVHSGESDPAGMLCRVLMLLMVIVPMAVVALLWWLA